MPTIVLPGGLQLYAALLRRIDLKEMRALTGEKYQGGIDGRSYSKCL
jgi:hypothetical protein